MNTAFDETTRSLIEEAAEWRMIELLFRCPSGEWKEQLADLSTQIRDEDLLSAVHHAVHDASEGVFHSIFGPGGPAPAREASYQNTVQLGQVLSEIRAFYKAFAFNPDSEEALDHISVEASFIGFLCLKEAFAISAGSAEDAEIARTAKSDFIKQHMACVAEPLSKALDESGEAYLECAGRALLRRVGSRPSQLFDILDNSSLDDSVFECGSAG